MVPNRCECEDMLCSSPPAMNTLHSARLPHDWPFTLESLKLIFLVRGFRYRVQYTGYCGFAGSSEFGFTGIDLSWRGPTMIFGATERRAPLRQESRVRRRPHRWFHVAALCRG